MCLMDGALHTPQGFDFDYTLARYSQEMQSLIYTLALKHMVQELHYHYVMVKRSQVKPKKIAISLARIFWL